MDLKVTTDLTVRDLCEGFVYVPSENKGLYGLNGKLQIQPEYQRNYLYGDGKKDVAVIESILSGFPLGMIYLYKVGDDKYELLDGQQRLTSIGRFKLNMFTIQFLDGPHYFKTLPQSLRDTINNYKLWACYCEGKDYEIFDWFKTLNIQGVPLNDQEVYNAIYHGPFVNLMRAKFANPSSNYVSETLSKFMSGNVKRQDYVKQAIEWTEPGGSICDYMGRHQNDTNIDEIVEKVESICTWIVSTFKCAHPLMQGLDWGHMYLQYHNNPYDSNAVHARMNALISDYSVHKKRGIFEYILNGEHDANKLDIRIFDINTKWEAWTRQTEEAEASGHSNCPMCACTTDNTRNQRIYELDEMEADHITAWKNGGSTTSDNCQMLCKTHNRMKGSL